MADSLLIAILGFAAGAVGLLAWRSKGNVYWLSSAAISTSVIAIPSLFSNVLLEEWGQAVDRYVQLSLVGIVGSFAGLGLACSLVSLSPTRHQVLVVRDEEIIGWCVKLVVVGVVAMLIAYAVMGFVPAFSDSPHEAKFFKGEYRAGYVRVAWLFRGAQALLGIATVPLIYFGLKRADWGLLVLCAIALGVSVVSMNRFPAFFAVLLGGGLFLCERGRVLLFCCLAFFATGGAAVSYYFIGDLLGLEALQIIYGDATNVFDLIAASASDLRDQLWFIAEFDQDRPYNFGKTFFGGLIPMGADFNPGVWMLSIIAPGVPFDELASGGARMPSFIWGYAAFGLFGAFVVPFLSVFIAAAGVRLSARSMWQREGVEVSALVKYAFVVIPLSQFYVFTTNSVLQIACALLVCNGQAAFRIGKRKRGAAAVSGCKRDEELH